MAIDQAARRAPADLTQLADLHGSDKGSRHNDRHGYTYLYDLMLAPFRDQPIQLLEIGLACGGPETSCGMTDRVTGSPSVGMWLDYFPAASITGFDISDFSHVRNKRFTFIQGDAGNLDDLNKLVERSGGFDVIIDDGSHASYHQQLCLKTLWPHLRDGGLYIIEDLHWQSPVYEGTLPNVPLTADLFASAFERGERFDTALFSASEIELLKSQVASFGLFRDHNGSCDVPKLLVLRKQGQAGRQSAQLQTYSVPDDSEQRPRVRSFDLFDTLVARRCIWPKVIFEMMERQLGLAGFAAARVRAEEAVMGDHYTLADIYKRLGSDHPILLPKIEELQALEIGLELQQLFPIAENVSQVSPGDLIVSDMYLPFQVLQVIVQEVLGLRDVFIFVTTQGKARGEVWPPLRSRFDIVEHLGDNPHSDIVSPNSFGIPAHLTESWQPTEFEKKLEGFGLKHLSQACREARLRSWSWRRDERQLQILQTNVNAPLLLIATVLVLRAARQAGIEHILASGRDCYLWLLMIQQLQEELAPGVTSQYFLTGRVPRTFPSASYKDYVGRAIGGRKTFVLDLCGSGLSLKRLFRDLDQPTAQPLLVHKMKATTVWQRSFAPPLDDGMPVYALLDPTVYYDNIPAELANPAPHPTVFDVIQEDGIDRPVHPEWPIEPITRRFATVQEAAFRAALPVLLARPVLDEVYGMPSEALATVLGVLYSDLGLFSDTTKAQMPEQAAENAMVCSTVLETERRYLESVSAAAE